MKKKELGLAAAALMAGALAGGGTLAYFTYSATETNTFTVGALDIDEDEPDWDDDTDGKNLMPGVIRYKNPTVTNTTSARNGSKTGYFRMRIEIQNEDGSLITDQSRLNLIENTIYYDKNYSWNGTQGNTTSVNLKETTRSSLTLPEITTAGIPHYNTELFTKVSNTPPGVLVYNYKDVLAAGSSATLFTHIVIPADWGEDEMSTLGTYQIVVKTQAIQSDGFGSFNEAMTALEGALGT